jgi:hypothetical protein
MMVARFFLFALAHAVLVGGALAIAMLEPGSEQVLTAALK